ncbi:UV-induced protein uvi15 [Zancudomyces culisetae]|uniref:UV-induced protein uvi15 n=1 Tax=Zancudomyces culisetae TaxID=1213189 RepID=A0A1R1PH95_ZANCU|nr:UV-induced protein uvi15 [Zancudomyces culisetae]|eukprot:OMH80299.1 UV-induced protein uvi15 [Zancudomyces culisetae]
MDKGYGNPNYPQQGYGGQQGYPPPPGYGGPQQGYGAPQAQPQVVYVQQPQQSSSGPGFCGGLCAALAVCCCLDMLC